MDIIKDIEETLDTFQHICDWANKTSGMAVDTGTRKEEIYHVYNRCQRVVEQLLKNESTKFMITPVVEHYFSLIRQAVAIPAEELIAGNSEKLREYKSFIEKLANHPIRNQWAEKAEEFRAIAESAGYTFERGDYKDLAIIAPIVADAMTALDTYYGKQIYHVRDGIHSQSKPVLLDDIAIFASVAEAVQLYEKLPPKSFIGFFGIEQTYGDTNNNFDDWRFGKCARKANIMQYEHLTEEEYAKTVDRHSRKIYVIVRDGENIWLFQPPIQQSQNECIADQNSFINYFGYRATYAPIQIFFKSTPPGDEKATMLIPYRKRRWSLKDILDEEQKVWLPIFFSAVKNKFFGSAPVECEKALIHEETHVVMALPSGNRDINLPVIMHNVMNVPTPEKLFAHDQIIDENGAYGAFVNKSETIRYNGALSMIRWLGITSNDIADAPIGFSGMQSSVKAKNIIEQQTVAAYYKVIRSKLAELWRPRAHKAQEWYHQYLGAHIDELIEDIKSNKINAKITIDKTPIYNEDGSPRMVRTRGYRGDLIQDTVRTDMDDGHRVQIWGENPIHEYRDWFPVSLMDKHPPVVVFLNPQTPEEVAKICHCTVEEMPEAIQYMNIVEAFNGHHAKFNARITLIFSKPEYKKRFLKQ